MSTPKAELRTLARTLELHLQTMGLHHGVRPVEIVAEMLRLWAYDDTTDEQRAGLDRLAMHLLEILPAESETIPKDLPAGYGWCPGCHEADAILDGHFACRRPPRGYVGGELEVGGWTAVPR